MILLNFFFVKAFHKPCWHFKRKFITILSNFVNLFFLSLSIDQKFLSFVLFSDINRIQKNNDKETCTQSEICKKFVHSCLDTLLKRTSAKFHSKINLAWVGTLSTFHFLNKRHSFHKTLNLCLELYFVFFIMALVQSNKC